ncbi:tetratricopeptide repeat protein [Kitasatospora phosalacinea]|uniref:tetratricopeptide repeat protein n=1 Tax=Kitasatospora phosalacinea TaxID=2065 RepID=UPI0035DB56DA
MAQIVSTAAGGNTQMVVLVGSSSTGKTRACWEAVQPLASLGWRLWHPIDPTRPEAALADLERVPPHTVVWLNEAQHYLGAGQGLGERIAAALRTLISAPERSPVLILGTLWPEYVHDYMAVPEPGQRDLYSQVRALIADRRVELPEHFDTAAITATERMAASGDRQLSHALAHARDGRLAQFLAGAPELLHRYRAASPAVRAILQVAMDARRFAAGPHLPMAFLAHAAEDYLTDDEYDSLEDSWLDRAIAEAGATVHGNFAPLRRVRNRPARRARTARPAVDSAPTSYRLADYLEQHGRHERQALCPPGSFWEAAYIHLTHPDDLARLADAAKQRLRWSWADALYRRAADAGDISALVKLYEMRTLTGDHDDALACLLKASQAGSTDAMCRLGSIRQAEGDHKTAEVFYQQAVDAGETHALLMLAELREGAGAYREAEALYREASDAGHSHALEKLTVMMDAAGEHDAAEQLALEAAATGNTRVLRQLAVAREQAGDRESAEALARQAADIGDDLALLTLADARRESGDPNGAKALAHEDALAGNSTALSHLAATRLHEGDVEGAEILYEELLLTARGYVTALAGLAELRERSGNRAEAEALAWEAARHGDTYTLLELAHSREAAGDFEGAEALHRQCVEAGHDYAVVPLIELLERLGRHEEADKLAAEAADAGDWYALVHLSELREEAAPDIPVPVLRYGLEPDGTLSSDAPAAD